MCTVHTHFQYHPFSYMLKFLVTVHRYSHVMKTEGKRSLLSAAELSQQHRVISHPTLLGHFPSAESETPAQNNPRRVMRLCAHFLRHPAFSLKHFGFRNS